jgi:hypothetical protein
VRISYVRTRRSPERGASFWELVYLENQNSTENLVGIYALKIYFVKNIAPPISSIPVKSRTVARSPNFGFLLTIHFDFRLSLGNRSGRHSRWAADPYLLERPSLRGFVFREGAASPRFPPCGF